MTLQMESTFDWNAEQWKVPVSGVVSRVFDFGGQLVGLGTGIKYHAESGESDPEGWGGRLVVSFLFSK